MSGYCSRPGCGRPVEGRTDQCATHNTADRKLLRTTAIAIEKLATRKSIPKRTEKRKEEDEEYNRESKLFLVGKQCAVFPHLKATAVHHIKGRRGYADQEAKLAGLSLYLDKRFWLAVSKAGHDKIHDEHDWAIEKGFKILRSA